MLNFEDEEVFLCLEGARISERAERKVWVLLNVFARKYLERGYRGGLKNQEHYYNFYAHMVATVLLYTVTFSSIF